VWCVLTRVSCILCVVRADAERVSCILCGARELYQRVSCILCVVRARGVLTVMTRMLTRVGWLLLTGGCSRSAPRVHPHHLHLLRVRDHAHQHVGQVRAEKITRTF